MDHRAGEGTREELFRIKHNVALTGELARITGAAEIAVNSLHGQGIDQLAEGLAVEATAPDGTIEAVRVTGAKNFAIAVQWHPEWEVTHFEDRKRLFTAFGEACAAYRTGLKRAA
jgi:putative glutamine amidotransferase